MKTRDTKPGSNLGRVLVTGTSIRQHYLDKLAQNGFEVDNPHKLLSEKQLQQRLKGAVAYLLGGDEYASKFALETANNLKVIAYYGMGYQSGIDVDAATAKRIPITYTPGTLSISTAEFTFAHILNLVRSVTIQNNFIKHGDGPDFDKGHELAGKRLGIIGLGGVGTEVARIARLGFRMDVAYFSRTRKPEVEKELGINYMQLDDLLKTSYIVCVLIPGNHETRNFIGKRELALMRQDSLLIVTGRPWTVDPIALKQALTSNKLAAASMDNYYENPYPKPKDDEYGLLTLPDSKFIVTAWTGSLTHEARDAMSEKATNSIINIVTTGKDQFVANGLK